MSEAKTRASPAGEQTVDVDAVVVGAGFSGLYMLHSLRELGLSARVFEMGEDVGGTWYWNRYPGARCDSESHIYCYSFSEELLEEWEWTERYPERPEIHEYLQFAADHLGLYDDIQFGTRVEAASYDEETGTWTVETDGETVRTRFFITAVGCLSKPYIPEFDGRDRFEGEQHHTARWPEGGVEFADREVGVIGTGSTGIQLIPEVAERAGRLTVFQRTPNYAVPARNRELESGEYDRIRDNYDEIWDDARHSWLGMPFDNEHKRGEGLSEAEIREALERRWQQGGFRFLHTFEVGELLLDEQLNRVVSEFIREKIRERVDDPETAEALVPSEHPYGAKRPPMDYNGYYETFNRENVRLADVDSDPIERFTPDGIRTSDDHYDLDVVVFATGFDAMTGAILDIDIEGRDGYSLQEKWATGPETYLGLGVHGFPNMFTITGPQSPSVLSNMPVSIEQHVEWISDCLAHMESEGADRFEVTADAEANWVRRCNELAESMLFSEADSWYRGANVPGKARTFMPFPGGVKMYRQVCEGVASRGYDGFEFATNEG